MTGDSNDRLITRQRARRPIMPRSHFFPAPIRELRRRPAFRPAAAACLALSLLAATVARAQKADQNLQGRVLNATRYETVPNVSVQYIQLQQGMTPVETVETDDEGRFQFTQVPFTPTVPGLIRVEFQGATYSQPYMEAATNPAGVEMLVFESSGNPQLVRATEHAIVLQPQGEKLAVIEQIFLENSSNPPLTYVNREGTYLFTLPSTPLDGVTASVVGAAGMPIPQTPVQREASNQFAINYPVHPGETTVRLQYSIDYQSPFPFAKPLDLAAERTHVVTPNEGVTIQAENLIPADDDPSTGFIAYEIQPADGRLLLEVSGQAPAGSSANTNSPGGSLTRLPDPVGERKWLIMGGLGLVMMAGLLFLYRRE